MAARDSRKSARVLGLTGPIACGKSTVGDLLLEMGVLERIDADLVVHDLLASDGPASRAVGAEFGPGVTRADGGVDRARLGELVFADPTALVRLERILHPAVRSVIRARVQELESRDGVIVIDAVKLLQSELLELCDAVWVVRCSAETQVRRLRDIRRMSAEAVEGRLAAQPSFDHPRVTTVIENSGSLEDLRERVRAAWAATLESWHVPVGHQAPTVS